MFTIEALANDPNTVRGAMLVLMARIAHDAPNRPIHLRAAESYDMMIRRQLIIFTAFVD